MQLVACLSDPNVVAKILAHLGLPTSPPPLSPARWPEQLGLLIDCDQTGTADSADCPDAARPPRSGPLCRAPPSADDGDRVVELDGPTDTDD